MYSVFRRYDAELVEVNPLGIMKSGQVVAAEGKININDNALFRLDFIGKNTLLTVNIKPLSTD